MNEPHTKTALITGASSGIGAEFARQLAVKKYRLIISARRRDRLQILKHELVTTHKIDVEIIVCDLTSENGPQNLYNEIKARELAVDLLINNAGFGLYQEFIQNEPQKLADMITLNITALTVLTRLIAEDMKAKGQGQILMVASTAAFQPIPYHAAYAASKAYVHSLGAALYEELKPYGIHVTTLCPGLTATEFFEVADFKPDDFLKKITMSAEDVVKSGLKALEKKKAVQIAGWLNRSAKAIVRLLPQSFTSSFMAKAQRRRGF